MTTEWIPVGALGDAFAPENNCLPPVSDLAGRTFTLNFENGWKIEHRFLDDGTLAWRLLAGEGQPGADTEHYVATRPRPGVYFVDFIKNSERATSVSLVLDLDNRVFLAVLGELPDRAAATQPMLDRIARGDALTGVDARFLRGTLDHDFSANAPLPCPTAELIGKRIEYRYSTAEHYEHIYLNEDFYTWHCLAGSEYGLCDTDACHYYRIRDGLYLFVWREKLIPTLGVICIDLQALKTSGKIFGYEENDFASTRNFSVGAYASIVGSRSPTA